jgi:hypothetical protein
MLLFISELTDEFLSSDTLEDKAFHLFILETPAWINPPIAAPPITILAFCNGGSEDLDIAFPTAPDTPAIVPAIPILLPTVLIPWLMTLPAYLSIDTCPCKLMSFSLK